MKKFFYFYEGEGIPTSQAPWPRRRKNKSIKNL